MFQIQFSIKSLHVGDGFSVAGKRTYRDKDERGKKPCFLFIRITTLVDTLSQVSAVISIWKKIGGHKIFVNPELGGKTKIQLLCTQLFLIWNPDLSVNQHLWMFITYAFSPTRPSGPSWSTSHKVCLCVVCVFVPWILDVHWLVHN